MCNNLDTLGIDSLNKWNIDQNIISGRLSALQKRKRILIGQQTLVVSAKCAFLWINSSNTRYNSIKKEDPPLPKEDTPLLKEDLTLLRVCRCTE